MNYRETTKIVIDECYLALSKVEEKQIDMLIDYLFNADKVFLLVLVE